MQDGIAAGTPAFRRAACALTAAGFSTFAVLYAVQPLLPVFAREFGVGPAASSLPLSLSTGLLAVALLVVSPLSEVFGRKPVMTVSLVCAAILTLVAAAMPTWEGFLAMRALAGLAMSGVPAVAMAYLAEEMDGRALGLAMGLLISGNALGGMCGRLLGGVLADLVGWRGALATIGVLALAAALAFRQVLPDPVRFTPHPLPWRTVPGSFLRHLRDPGLPWLFAEAFLLMGGFVTLYNYIGFRLQQPPYDLSQTAVAAIFTVYLAGTAASTAAGHAASLFGHRRVLWAAIAAALAGIGLTLCEGLVPVVLGIVVATVGFFGAHSVASGWVGRRAREDRAQASSLYLFLYYLGSSVLGTAGGWFYARAGWAGVAGFVGALYGAALLAALRLAALPPRPDAPAVPAIHGSSRSP